MNRIQLDNVIVEVTRRCQLACGHCLRGEAENMDQKAEHIKNLVSRVSQIGTVTFSGGEPALNVRALRYFLAECKRQKVDVGNFYVATNGIIASDSFIRVLIDWYLYCSDNECSAVEVSNDGYHADEKQGMKVGEARLKCLSFAHNKWEKVEYHEPISEGRSEGMGNREPRDYGFDVDMEQGYVSEGDFYLNCKGEVISGCDFSYENQSRHKVCDISNLTLEALRDYKKPEEAK